MNKVLKFMTIASINPQGDKVNTLLPAVSWYKSLSLQQKMGLKEVSVLICGMKWEDFNTLFTPRERLEILHNKLMMEGFDV